MGAGDLVGFGGFGGGGLGMGGWLRLQRLEDIAPPNPP